MNRLTTLLLRSALDAAYFSGLHRRFANRHGGPGCILMLHRIVDGDGARGFRPNIDFEISPGFLRALLRYFRARDWDVVTLDALPERLHGGTHRRFVCFTFDDGYRDNLELALPVFKAFDAPFAVYVTTGFIDGSHTPWWYALETALNHRTRIDIELDGQHTVIPAANPGQKRGAFWRLRARLVSCDRAERDALVAGLLRLNGIDAAALHQELMLSWSSLAELAAEPLVTIGAHSVTHPALAALGDEDARGEMQHSKATLSERLKVPVAHFGYPYGGPGECGPREYGIARQLGFTTAVTARKAMLRREHAASLLALPRLAVKGRLQALRYLKVHLSGFAPALYQKLASKRSEP